MRTCQKCGTQTEDDDLYCPDCGIKLKVVKKTRKITAWTIFKVIGIIIFFIFFINVFKNQPIIALVLLVLFLIWTGIVNSILKKLFNAELSIGVKIIITVILIILFLVSTQKITSTPQIAKEDLRVKPEMPIEVDDVYHFIEKINKIIESKEVWRLEEMLEGDMISHEVFKDVQHLFDNNIHVSLELMDRNFYGDQAELIVEVVIETDYEKRREKTTWFFQKTNQGWKLFNIEPRLSDLKISKSFEGEVEYKLEHIKKPIIAVSETGVSTEYMLKRVNS